MKKIETQIVVLLLAMLAFCGIMLFGIFYGSKHPQIFFWGFMAVFAIIVATFICPTLKDIIILIVGMIILAIAGTFIENFIVKIGLLAPIYFPLFNHFMNMCKKATIQWKKQDNDIQQ